MTSEVSSFEEFSDARMEQQEQQIRELQTQLEEAAKLQAAVDVVSKSKLQKALAITEDRMLEHLDSPSHEEELTSLLADFADLDDFRPGEEGELLPPGYFLLDLKNRIMSVKTAEVVRFEHLKGIVLAKILERKKNNVESREMHQAGRPSLTSRSRSGSRSGVERTSSQVRSKPEGDAEDTPSDMRRLHSQVSHIS